MTHEDSGHYAEKHPKGTKSDPGLTDAVNKVVKDGEVSCAAAHKVAADAGVTPAEVGTAIDLLEYRICKCQIGLFGYGPGKNRVRPADVVTPDLAAAIKASRVDGRLPCAACWELAKKTGITRMQASEACEALQVKIKPCQLGAF